jgi:hypothetical protein
MTDVDQPPTFTPFSPCRHGTLQVMETHALGITVGCVHCNETFFLDPEVVEEKYYHFIHHSHKGPADDIELLIHYKIIER